MPQRKRNATRNSDLASFGISVGIGLPFSFWASEHLIGSWPSPVQEIITVIFGIGVVYLLSEAIERRRRMS